MRQWQTGLYRGEIDLWDSSWCGNISAKHTLVQQNIWRIYSGNYPDSGIEYIESLKYPWKSSLCWNTSVGFILMWEDICQIHLGGRIYLKYIWCWNTTVGYISKWECINQIHIGAGIHEWKYSMRFEIVIIPHLYPAKGSLHLCGYWVIGMPPHKI